MRLYIFNENCIRAAQVAGEVSDGLGAQLDNMTQADRDDVLAGLGIPDGDCHIIEGERCELIAECVAMMQADWTSLTSYKHRRADNVLRYFGVESE